MAKSKDIKAYGVSSFYHYKILYISMCEGDNYENGTTVVFCDNEGNHEIGEVIATGLSAEKGDLMEGASILRKVTEHDLQRVLTNKESSAITFEACKELITKYALNMNLIDAIYSLDGARINFIFTSDERVDFRELVKEAAKKFQKQIHLQQIGPRDKARVVRGYGKCGRKLCCAGAVGKLKSITMDMVRIQGMSNKGSEKLSGVCGKLMCCLAFEVKEYEELKKNLPPYLSEVKLTDGRTGIVRGMDVLNQKIRVATEDDFFVTELANVKSFKLPKNEHAKSEEGGNADIL